MTQPYSSSEHARSAEKIADPTVRHLEDATLIVRTGRSWDGWYTALDAAGAAGRGLADNVRYLRQAHGLGDWFAWAIALSYDVVRRGRS